MIECWVVRMLGVELEYCLMGGCKFTGGLPGVLIRGIASPADMEFGRASVSSPTHLCINNSLPPVDLTILIYHNRTQLGVLTAGLHGVWVPTLLEGDMENRVDLYGWQELELECRLTNRA